MFRLFGLIWTGVSIFTMDDGVDGYLSARLDKYGKLVCSGIATPNTTVVNYKSGSTFGDPTKPI